MADQIEIEDFKAAIRNCKGQKNLIAQELGVTRQTVFNWLNRHPELKAACDEWKTKLIELARCRLWDQVEAGDPRCIMFVLKCQDGWTETSNLNVQSEGQITINVLPVAPEELDYDEEKQCEHEDQRSLPPPPGE